MSLDLYQTAAQLRQLTDQLHDRRSDRASALAAAQSHLAAADPRRLEERRLAGRSTWMAAVLDDGLAQVYSPDAPPTDYVVVAVDGSHIDIDRHSAARCYLINTGHVYLRYGEPAEARLWSTPTLRAEDDALVLRDPSGLRELPVEGPLLGVKRAVQEVEALADLVEQAPPELPVLALLDGTLILWGLAGQAYPDFVRDELLEGALIPALDRLRALSERRRLAPLGAGLAVASYISLPRSTDVVNALRHQACTYETVTCDRNCGGVRSGERPCDAVAGITDQDLFAARLGPGERSPLYRSLSSIMEHYGGHRVHFFYMSVGEEVARVEVPGWVADSAQAISFAQAAILAQAEKGHGYPVSLSESHEQAVVTGQDREQFRLLLEEALEAERLPVFSSEKAHSKRARFL